MDQKDRQILQQLQINGRLTNQELAEKVNLSPSPCLRRTRNLEEKGIITGYTALVDQSALGLSVTVFIRLKLQTHSETTVQEFEQAVKDLDNILDCYLMTGDSDYLLRVAVKDLVDYEQFVRKKIHRLPHVASIDTSFAYGVIKQTHTY
ncbi:MAG: Lrp/AsnC family transcriptional regulator [Alphaproteobacteria bacterium]|nr:Lrp/AsnC family transcriptional regulator [Alphaproteobacteria bacterium]